MNMCLAFLSSTIASFFFAIPIESTYMETMYNEAKIIEIASKINYSRPNHADLDPNLYEGDIYLSEEERELVRLNLTIYGNAISDPDLLWPEGKVYYNISSIFKERERTLIEDAMDHIRRETCVQFVDANIEQPSHGHSILIDYKKKGCSSRVGFQTKVGSQQLVNLAPGCFRGGKMGTAEHELLHAIGLYHEQSRLDRDEYIFVYRQNIIPELLTNFNLKLETTTFGLPYDYGSVMQYPNDAFAKVRGSFTMVARMDPRICLGNRHSATQCDLEKVRRLYGCKILNNCVPSINLAFDNRCNLYA